MTWAESDLLTWDEREVLLLQADKLLHRSAPAGTPAHVPAAERLAKRVAG